MLNKPIYEYKSINTKMDYMKGGSEGQRQIDRQTDRQQRRKQRQIRDRDRVNGKLDS